VQRETNRVINPVVLIVNGQYGSTKHGPCTQELPAVHTKPSAKLWEPVQGTGPAPYGIVSVLQAPTGPGSGCLLCCSHTVVAGGFQGAGGSEPPMV
jgi:hypothetical protein